MLNIIGIQNTCLKNLSMSEKKDCLRAMAYISKLDGHLETNEVYIVALLAKTLDLTDTRLFLQNLDENEILLSLSAITDRKVALEILKFLCFIGHADNNLTDNEVLFIGNAANAMGVELSKVQEINDWIIDGFILKENERQIFEKTTKD